MLWLALVVFLIGLGLNKFTMISWLDLAYGLGILVAAFAVGIFTLFVFFLVDELKIGNKR